MSTIETKSSSHGSPIGNSNKFDFWLFLHYCYKHWYLFIVCLGITYMIGKAYIRYAQPVYAVNAMVLIKDAGSYSAKSSGQFMEGLGMFKMSYNLYNEIEIIKSYSLVLKAVKALDFEVSYFVSGTIKTGEIYQSSPFKVVLDSNAVNQTRGVPFYVYYVSDSTYKIIRKNPSSGNPFLFWRSSSSVMKEYHGVYGKPLVTPDFSITVTPSVFFSDIKNAQGEYYFIINDLYSVASNYASRLTVVQQSKYSSLVSLSVSGGMVEKEINFLNKLTDAYIQYGLDEKNEITVNTIKFIDDQLAKTTDSLQNSANQLEQFRNKENLIVVEGNSEKAYEELDFLEKRKAEIQIQIKYYQYLYDYISQNQDLKKVVAPSAVGISDLLLNQLVAELYILQSEQTSLAFSAQEKNHTFTILEIKIKNTKETLIENLRNLLKTSNIYLKDNEERLQKTYALLYKLPKSQRYLAALQRQYNVNEKIYNLLLEKKTEADIAKASNVSDNKVINQSTLGGKIFPNEALVNKNAMLYGILTPFLIIVLLTYFNSKIVSKGMITRKTNIPIIGTLGHFEGESTVPVLDFPKSSFSESMRAMRLNLQYLATHTPKKVIGVTSTISGEGKTFFALNLSLSLLHSGAKVVLLGADLRRPRLTSMINLPHDKGISSYVIGKHSMDEIILKNFISHLDIVPGGPVPPNPSELIESERFSELIMELKKRYDFVVIDTSPVGLVADYLLMAKHTDINLFMLRHDYTKIGMVEDLEVFKNENGISALYLVYNDVEQNLVRMGTGYKYGYGYGTGKGYNYGHSGYYATTNDSRKTMLGRVVSLFRKKENSDL
ncbi:MAG TPA: polysaccharide biosynthesis tyrosine autokinase [Cytophagaceae bacterium]|jgi:tyrosine-protein kinase Etk/Wzc|nr:polysaccharide biosynthesis tyrosine autokinase [Cytophagaceae bacterium]